MRLVALTEADEIEDAFDSLGTYWQHSSQAFHRKVGWSGGSGEFSLYWRSDLGVWALFENEYAETRYWCCFGTTNPSDRKQVGITCEINFPYEDFDRRVAGAFVRNSADQVYITHSGNIKGGRKGISKSNLIKYYAHRFHWESVHWPDKKKTDVIVIGPLESPILPQLIARFVREIKQFKDAATSNKLHKSKLPTFLPEFTGSRQSYRAKSEIESHCYHGLVIDALASELEQREYTVGNDKQRDLYIQTAPTHPNILFEAKTDISSSSIYTAVGQLMLYGAAEEIEPKRVVVLPGIPKKETKAALDRLYIRVLTYQWDDEQATFDNLDEVLE